MTRPEVTYRYEIIIYWSDEDEAFVAEVPELPGCAAHGDTPHTALSNCGEAITLWIDTAKETGRPILAPQGRRSTRPDPRTFGHQLIESAQEAVKIERGETKPARLTRYPAADPD